LAIFPNRFVKNQLQINVEEEIEMLRIYSSIGQTIHVEQVKSGKKIFNLAHLPSGIYFIQLETKAAIGHVKIIKK
jgi:thiamine phosphate synthase YjbQ (UPF0047 family)